MTPGGQDPAAAADAGSDGGATPAASADTDVGRPVDDDTDDVGTPGGDRDGDATGTHGGDPPDGGDGTAGDGDEYVWRDWTREDLKRSAVAGVAAYLATYALLYLWFLSEGRMSGAFTDWRWVGWILYHGQFVPLDVSAGSASAGAATLVETGLGDRSNVVPALLLSVAVALLAGFLLARARDPADPDAAVGTGASLVVGYLPPAVLGVVVFGGTLPNGVHVRPSPLVAPIVTGVVFPAVVGAVGGLIYVAWRQRGATGGSAPDRRAGSETTRESSEPVEEGGSEAESPDPRS